jgi:hypothetical protein
MHFHARRFPSHAVPVLVAILAAFGLLAGCADIADPQPAEESLAATSQAVVIPPNTHECLDTYECEMTCSIAGREWNGRCHNSDNACMCTYDRPGGGPASGEPGFQLCSWHYVWTAAHGYDYTFDGCVAY